MPSCGASACHFLLLWCRRGQLRLGRWALLLRRGRRRRVRHSDSQALLRIVAPVFAVEPEEDGRVGHGQPGLENENVNELPGLVNVADHLFVGHRLDVQAIKKLANLGAVLIDAGGIVLGEEGQFGVHEDVGANVDGAADGSHDIAEDIELVGIGIDGFDPGRGLQGVSRIDDEDPVAVAEQGQVVGDLRLPSRRSGGGQGRRGGGELPAGGR